MHWCRGAKRRGQDHSSPRRLGERPPDEGTIKAGEKVVLNYIDQARMQLKGAGTVLQEIAEAGSRFVWRSTPERAGLPASFPFSAMNGSMSR
ncbi:MAG: hypothetical protein U1G07_15865 [Verrucomicrobiota bacterium]